MSLSYGGILQKHKKNSNVVNVGRLFRANVGSNRKKRIRVSPTAIREYTGRIVDNIETNAPLIAKIAIDNKRTTILDRDVVRFFGYAESDVVQGED